MTPFDAALGSLSDWSGAAFGPLFSQYRRLASARSSCGSVDVSAFLGSAC